MNDFDASAAPNGQDRAGCGPRQLISCSGLLAVATATAVLVSGLNGLVQIMKIVIECGYAR
jgi:hypothetical protein